MSQPALEPRPPVRLLLSAYACHPEDGSEPGVGWQFLQAALRTCGEVHVLTRENNIAPIEKGLSPDQKRRCRVIGFDLSPDAQKWKKRVKGGTQAYYIAWQIRAQDLVRRLHALYQYDLAHHVTFAVDWAPVAVGQVEGLPFVWGPVGGTQKTPLSLLSYLGPNGLLTEALRVVSGAVGRRVISGKVAHNAALTVASNQEVTHRFRRLSKRIVTEPNVLVAPSLIAHAPTENLNGPIVGLGRLVPWKGWALALEAIARIPDRRTKLVLLGEGPDRNRIAARARRLGIADRVVFAGHVPRMRALKALHDARALLFPSFHDSAGWAVGEALAIGCPVVCLNLGGPPELVGRSGGSIIAHDSTDLPGRLAAALTSPVRPYRCDTWSATRLPAVLEEWYGGALHSPPAKQRAPSRHLSSGSL